MFRDTQPQHPNRLYRPIPSRSHSVTGIEISKKRRRRRRRRNEDEEGGGIVDDLIQNAGGCAVVDGGFATQLEKHGAVFIDSLWSAACLIDDPDLIKKVHLEYLEAGADVLVSSSYQVSAAN